MFHFRKIKILAQTLSLRKIVNFGKIYTSFHVSRLLGKSYHWGNPMKVGIEPTTSCNLRCPECPSGLRSFTRPTGMLKLSDFEQMIAQLHQDLIYLLLYFQGEPYLNKAFFDMAKAAKEKGIYSATSTNGHYLTLENARKTVNSGLSELIISIDGTTQEVYEQYRVGGNLEKVKEGVRNLVQARTELNSLTPFLVIQFLVVKPNEHQIADIEILGKELGIDKVVFKTAQIYDYEQGSDLIPDLEKYSRYKKAENGTYKIKNNLNNQCWKLWHGAEITWDGKVLPCCFDKDGEFEMGNLLTQDFHSIWRSEGYHQFRNTLLKSRKEIEMCKNCSEGTEVWA
ncbi:MAG: radical SAM/SPASM domain-containing protein [Bacteroidia bacterium]